MVVNCSAFVKKPPTSGNSVIAPLLTNFAFKTIKKNYISSQNKIYTKAIRDTVLSYPIAGPLLQRQYHVADKAPELVQTLPP